MGNGDYSGIVREQTRKSSRMYDSSCPLHTPYIRREIHKDQTLLCNLSISEQDTLVCSLEMVLPCWQDREGAGVEQEELRELCGGRGARVLQEEPGGGVRGVGDGCACGCDVGVGKEFGEV